MFPAAPPTSAHSGPSSTPATGAPRGLGSYAIALAAILPYVGALWNPPILDDGWTALQNPLVWKLSNAGRVFGELYGWAGPASVRGPYRPLTTLSFSLNWAVGGDDVVGFHLVNIALHAIASLLVAALAGHLARAAVPGPDAAARASRVSLVAGLLFAVHPAHAESVVTIFGRTEPLSAVFALWALLLALRARRARGVAAAALVLAAGILSKEVAVMVPPLYLLVAWAVPAGAGLAARPGIATPEARRALLRAAAVAGALALAFVPWYVGHALAAHGASLGVRPEALWFPASTPRAAIAMTMSRVLAEYLRILAWPGFLGGDFAYATRIPTIFAPTFGFAAATLAWLAALAAGVVLLLRRAPGAPLVGAGILWIFVSLLPVLQLLVPVGVLLAERLLYLPSVGFCIAAAAALGGARPEARIPGPRRQARWTGPTAAVVVAAIAIPLLWARTAVRVLDWTSSSRFWESEVAKAPHEVTVNNNLAVAYTSEGRPAKAIERLAVALADQPTYWRAWVNLGIARGELHEFDAGRIALQRAVALAPAEADPQRFLGRMLSQAGDLPGAIRAYEQARRIAPEQAVLARELAAALLAARRPLDARAQLEDAIRLDPSDQASRALLARLR